MVPRLSVYSLQSAWWYSDYQYTHHSLTGGTQTIPILITVSLVILILFLYSSQPPGGTWAIPILITVSLVVLSLFLITSLSVLWYSEYPYTESHHSLHIGSDDPYTHHSQPGGSDNPYTHHSLPRGTQNIPLLITVCLVVHGLSLYSSQSPWWYSEYPFTHHNLIG